MPAFLAVLSRARVDVSMFIVGGLLIATSPFLRDALLPYML